MEVGDEVAAAPSEFFKQCPRCGEIWFTTEVCFQVGSMLPTAIMAELRCLGCLALINVNDIH